MIFLGEKNSIYVHRLRLLWTVAVGKVLLLIVLDTGSAEMVGPSCAQRLHGYVSRMAWKLVGLDLDCRWVMELVVW